MRWATYWMWLSSSACSGAAGSSQTLSVSQTLPLRENPSVWTFLPRSRFCLMTKWQFLLKRGVERSLSLSSNSVKIRQSKNAASPSPPPRQSRAEFGQQREEVAPVSHTTSAATGISPRGWLSCLLSVIQEASSLFHWWSSASKCKTTSHRK